MTSLAWARTRRRSAADHLRDALEPIAAIESYARKGKREFDRNAMLRDAVVERELPRLRVAAEAIVNKE